MFFPGTAKGFWAAWPAVRNFYVWQGGAHAWFSGLEAESSSTRSLIGDDLRDTASQLLRGRDVEELVGAVGVGAGAQDAGDQELRQREALAQHRHEGDRAALALVSGGPAEERGRGLIDRLA